MLKPFLEQQLIILLPAILYKEDLLPIKTVFAEIICDITKFMPNEILQNLCKAYFIETALRSIDFIVNANLF